MKPNDVGFKRSKRVIIQYYQRTWNSAVFANRKFAIEVHCVAQLLPIMERPFDNDLYTHPAVPRPMLVPRKSAPVLSTLQRQQYNN